MNAAGCPADTLNSALSVIPHKFDSMVHLPSEILIVIAKAISACRVDEEWSLRKALNYQESFESHPISLDVLKFRLVCKIFDQIGLTTLVDLIHQKHHNQYKTFILNPTMRSLEVLDAMVCNDKLRNLIARIELNVGPLERDVESFARYVSSRGRRAKAAAKRGDLPEPLIATYAQYLALHRQTQAFLTAASCAQGLHDFAAVLKKLPQLTMLSVDKHSAVYPANIPQFSDGPDVSTFGEPRWRIARFLLQAASVADIHPESLDIGHMDRYFFELAPVPDLTVPIVNLFGHLTRISISMACDKPVWERQDIRKWKLALSAAHSLEELALHLDIGYEREFVPWTTRVLRHQCWTNLRIVILTGFGFRWQLLDAFFKRHSHSLHKVQLENIKLHHGGWRYLLFNMRGSLSLKSAVFSMYEPLDLDDYPDRLADEGYPDLGRYVTKELY